MSDLERVFRAAIRAVDPAAATARALARSDLGDRRIWLIAIGKAARAMASGACDALGDRIAGGLVVVPESTGRGARLVELSGSHPVPDRRSVSAARALLALATAVPAHHRLLALISGGASALAALPAPGVTLEEKIARVQAAVTAGAPIAEVNALRTSLSAIKGGKLARACAAPVTTIVVSDVVGDDPAIVGSGPTIANRPGDEVIVASGVGELAAAAASAAREILGAEATIVDAALVGDVEVVAARVAAEIARQRGRILVWAGEPTLRLGGERGRGGRARHLALLVARALAGQGGWSLLVGASDGVDGTPDGAGAIVDGTTWARARDPEGALARFDSGTALAELGVALDGGATGINHADVLVASVL